MAEQSSTFSKLLTAAAVAAGVWFAVSEPDAKALQDRHRRRSKGLSGVGDQGTREKLKFARHAAQTFHRMHPDLVNNKCNAQAALMQRFLRKHGVTSTVVEGRTSGVGPHYWLEIDGKRFDPTLEPVGDSKRRKYSPKTRHEAFTCYARHPDYQDKLIAELDSELARGGLGRLPARVTEAHATRALKRLRRKASACGITAKSLREGMQVELEHRDVTRGGALQTAKIAAAHLCERPDYYRRLKKYVEA